MFLHSEELETWLADPNLICNLEPNLTEHKQGQPSPAQTQLACRLVCEAQIFTVTHCESWLVIFIFFKIFVHFRAALATYRSSQTRGQIRATAAGLHHSHSNSGSELHLQSTPQFTGMPLSEARGRTLILMDFSWIHFCCATTGTPVCCFSKTEIIRR